MVESSRPEKTSFYVHELPKTWLKGKRGAAARRDVPAGSRNLKNKNGILLKFT